jgi:hypothetical protein
MKYLAGGMRIQPGWASRFRISLWALMTNSRKRRACVALGIGHFLTILRIGGQEPSAFQPQIPKMWDDKEMARVEVPLAYPIGSPKHVSSQYYYKIPVRPIYKSYPLYAPGREPVGYRDWLKRQEPQIVWDDAGHRPILRTKADWIKAGEAVFESPLVFSDVMPDEAAQRLYAALNRPVAANGVDPFFSIVIRQKGKIEVGFAACADCHTRVMADGTIVKGAQGNSPTEHTIAFAVRSMAGAEKDKHSFLEVSRRVERAQFEVPWLPIGDQLDYNHMSVDEIAASHAALPPGVFARQRTSVLAPPHIPDLIGVKDRRYLDATGLEQHRGIVDLMRYAALNQGADNLATYDGFIPSAFPDFKQLPDPANLNGQMSIPQVIVGTRYSDEQLYALALYVYSLKPPPNPNRFDALAARGKEVFERGGCATCHTPRYTQTTS